MTTQPQTEQEILKKELEKIAKAHDLGDPTNISKSDNKYFKTWEGYSELIINAVAGNLEPEDYTVFPTIKEIEQALKSAIHEAYEAGHKATLAHRETELDKLIRLQTAIAIFAELDKISLGNNFDDFSEQGLKKNISDDLVLDDLKTYQALKSRHLKDSDKKD